MDDGEGLQCFAEPGWPEYQGRMCDGDADDLMTSNHGVSWSCFMGNLFDVALRSWGHVWQCHSRRAGARTASYASYIAGSRQEGTNDEEQRQFWGGLGPQGSQCSRGVIGRFEGRFAAVNCKCLLYHHDLGNCTYLENTGGCRGQESRPGCLK